MTEERTTIVCLPTTAGNPGGFDDNLYTTCARCEVPVQHRPHVPEPSDKLCLDCFVKEMKPTDKAGLTIETLVDLERASLK